MKVSANFELHEFVPKEIFYRFGESSIWFIDPIIIKLTQFARERFGKSITINDWNAGGHFNNSGFRTVDCAEGAKESQHRFGRAADWKVTGLTPDEVRADIIANFPLWKAQGLTTIEDGAIAKTWVHVDIRPTNLDHLLIVKP